MNLNHIIKSKTKFNLGSYPIDIELRLAEGFPELDETMGLNYGKAFGQLFDEIVHATLEGYIREKAELEMAGMPTQNVKPPAVKVRIDLGLEGKIQVVKLEHNGKPINDETLKSLNSQLADYEKDDSMVADRHGNLIAATILRKYGGRIRIYNISDNGYNVQTKVEIPSP